MNVVVAFKSDSGLIPLKKEFTHNDVMFWREEDERYVVFLKESKLTYSKKHFELRNDRSEDA